MMKAKRRRHSPEFKAKVGMEALKGVKTIQQLAKEFEVHPVQVSDWKKVIVENLAGVFEKGAERWTPCFGQRTLEISYGGGDE
jgi:transposase/putative transposase